MGMKPGRNKNPTLASAHSNPVELVLKGKMEASISPFRPISISYVVYKVRIKFLVKRIPPLRSKRAHRD